MRRFYCLIIVFGLLFSVSTPVFASTTTDFPFSLLWKYAIPIYFSTTTATSTPYCFDIPSSVVQNKAKSDLSDVWFVVKSLDNIWYAPTQNITLVSASIHTCFSIDSQLTNIKQYAVIFGNTNAPPPHVLNSLSNATALSTLDPKIFQATTKSLIGDIGMKSNASHIFFYNIVDQTFLFDCKNFDSPGDGPFGNVVKDGDSVSTATNKCALTNSENTTWHYWQGNIFSNLPVSAGMGPTITHKWTQPITESLYGGSISAVYPDGIAKNILVWHKTPGDSTGIYSATTTTSDTYWSIGTTYPHANELSDTLGSQSAIWQGTMTFNTLGNLLAQRLALPQIMACWSQSTGQSCYGQTPPTADGVAHYISFDINPAHADHCTSNDHSGCPPFHKDLTGKLVPLSDPSFPFDAYYNWCGSDYSQYEPKCPDHQESFNLQPSKVWEPYGFPATPALLNTPFYFTYDVLGLLHHLFLTSYPSSSIIYSVDTSTEILGAGATLEYSTSDWKLTGQKDFLEIPTGLPGDINSDGHVDIIDIGILIDNYGKVPIVNPKADVNSDGSVDIIDLGILVDNYGK
jgi:hypothetical protein